MVVAEVPDPVPAAHQVVVRPAFSLISSGTETASIHRDGLLKEAAANPSHLRRIVETMKTMGPLRTLREVRAKLSEYAVLGYSGAGVIVAKHPTVRDLEIGTPVAYGGEGTGHGELIVTGRQLVARVPSNVAFQRACFATLGSIALNAVRTAGVGLGDTVAVVGLGLVGQLVAQLARLQGAVVIGIDLRADRVEAARTSGAPFSLRADESLLPGVHAITDGTLADCVIVAAAAKSAAPCRQALTICRDRGRIVVVGAVEIELPWNEAYLKEIQLLMARAYGPGSYDPTYEQQGHDYPLPYVRWTENRNMEEFLRLLSTGQVQVDSLVTHRYTLDQAPAAYEAILEPGSRSLAVLLEYDQPEADGANVVRVPVSRVEISKPRPQAPGQLGVALVGAGNLARWAHLPALKKVPGTHLRAVYSSAGARGRTYAERFGASYCTTDLEEILGDSSVQVVLIASRNQDHASQAIKCLRAGKHVFVEKPMALTEPECRDVCEAVRETGLALTVGFNRRFSPDYVRLKEAIGSRSSPAVVNCRINSPGISGSYWMADPAIGGAILGEACHFVDLMCWLLDAEPVRVSAFSLPQDRRHPIGQNNLAATFQFTDGSVGTLAYSTVGSRTSGGERVEVFVDGLAVVADGFKQLTIHGAITRKSRRLFAAKGYEAQLAGFFDAIRGGRQPAVTAEDGARATLGCLRLLDAARTLDVVPFETGGSTRRPRDGTSQA
jgi:predicted dehydrogenase/threonine dehydrogenase-like Zn-dependent dehydrogenase